MMKKLTFLLLACTLLMCVSLTSCLDSSDSGTSYDGACTVYVYSTYGSPFFVDAIGNKYYPSSSSVNQIAQNNSNFEITDYKMMTIYYDFTVESGASKPTVSTDSSNPGSYNIDLVYLQTILVPDVVPAETTADIETVAPGTAPVLALSEFYSYGAAMFDDKTIIMQTGFYSSNDSEKYGQHTITMVYVLDEVTASSTNLTVYIQHDRGTDEGVATGVANVYGFNLQAAIQHFNDVTGQNPSKIIVKAKETVAATITLPTNYTEYQVEYKSSSN